MSYRKISLPGAAGQPRSGLRRREAMIALAAAPHARPMAADPKVGTAHRAIDDLVLEVLARQDVPSASIAVVRGGALAYARAYGAASRTPRRAATPATAYALGSTSKQFTAAAVVLLALDGALSLDEPIARWRPGFPEAARITLRQLLSHTAGLADYFPQTEVPLALRAAARPADIVATWGGKGLEFVPGSTFRYSSTGFMLAALIAEQVAKEPLLAQLRRRLFHPLGMVGAFDYDNPAGARALARGFTRDAFEAPRPAIREGAGWLYAAAGLGMTASDLARWNLALLGDPALKALGRELFNETRLIDGAGAGYGLGVFVETQDGRRKISHDGQVSGFLAENRVYPDDGLAISVLVNTEVGAPNLTIADRIARTLLAPVGVEARLTRLLEHLRAGREPSGLSPDAAANLSPDVRAAYRTSLLRLGPLRSVTLTDRRPRGGLDNRTYRLVFRHGLAEATLRTDAAGQVEELVLWPWFP